MAAMTTVVTVVDKFCMIEAMIASAAASQPRTCSHDRSGPTKPQTRLTRIFGSWPPSCSQVLALCQEVASTSGLVSDAGSIRACQKPTSESRPGVPAGDTCL